MPAKVTQEAQNAETYEAATILGADAETSDVGFAFTAQAEAAMAQG